MEKQWLDFVLTACSNPTSLSDYINDEEIARISGFCQVAEMDFHHLARPRNVSVDLKYDVL